MPPSPCRYVHHPRSSFKFTPLGFYGSQSYRHDQLLTQSLAPLPFQENRDRAESSKLLIMAWVFLVMGSHPEAIQKPRVTSLGQKTLPSPRKYHGLRSSVSGIGRRPNVRTQDTSSALIIQEITKVSGALYQEPGTDTHIFQKAKLMDFIYNLFDDGHKFQHLNLNN